MEPEFMVPKKFFITSGKAVSKVSDLNAFDMALMDAKISEQNLVAVSSVIPVGCKQIDRREIPMGAITHCVLAQQRGNEGESIAAGITYALRKDGMGGYVAEGHIMGDKKALKEILLWKMEEMAKLRNVELEEIAFRIEELSIPMDHYGTCLAACVFVFGEENKAQK
jgi:arginine decarboxylase